VFHNCVCDWFNLVGEFNTLITNFPIFSRFAKEISDLRIFQHENVSNRMNLKKKDERPERSKKKFFQILQNGLSSIGFEG